MATGLRDESMKDYKQVVEERYNSSDIKKNKSYRYGGLTKTGRIGSLTLDSFLPDYLKYLQKATQKDIDDLTVCDCGCGTGGVTRKIADILGNTKNVCGFEFSELRLNKCKEMNNCIEYKFGDLVKEIPEFSDKNLFDGMIASTVFMHIRKKEDVLSGLSNIYEKLHENGIFMWWEANSDTHYVDYESEWMGFSRGEMIEHAESVGFKLIKSMKINPILPVVGPLYYYKGNKVPEALKLYLQYHNKPFRCLNNVMWFKK